LGRFTALFIQFPHFSMAKTSYAPEKKIDSDSKTGYAPEKKIDYDSKMSYAPEKILQV
jgi:hypothetical protein